MNRITREQQVKMIEEIEKPKIFGWYNLQELKKEIAKGNETIRVLFGLLEKEINKHNGLILKKKNKLRDKGTID